MKRRTRVKNCERYEYWELVRTVRTANGPRHETVAYLGKLEEGEARRHYGWSDIDSLLEGREPDVQLRLNLPDVPTAPEPEWRRINVRGVRVEAPAILQKGGLFGCIKGVVGRLRFPPAGTSQIVSYPFSLS